MDKTHEDFEACIANLRVNIKAFDEGNRASYRSVAVELRKLMCDTNKGKDTSLLPRIFRDLHLHKLNFTKILEDVPSLRDGLFLMSPGRLSFDEGKATFKLKFSGRENLMPLSDWLQQWLLSPEITIRGLIKSVADKEGAHADQEFDDTLLFTRGIHFGDFYSHVLVVVAIGNYLLWFLDNESPDVGMSLC